MDTLTDAPDVEVCEEVVYALKKTTPKNAGRASMVNGNNNDKHTCERSSGVRSGTYRGAGTILAIVRCTPVGTNKKQNMRGCMDHPMIV